MADRLGISQSYVSELESGKTSLALMRIFDIMRLTGMTLEAEIPEGDAGGIGSNILVLLSRSARLLAAAYIHAGGPLGVHALGNPPRDDLGPMGVKGVGHFEAPPDPGGFDVSAGVTVEALGDPGLDDGLTGDAQTSGLGVERAHHPHREVDVDALNVALGPASRGEVELIKDVDGAVVERGIEFTGLHTMPPPLLEPVAPR